MGKFRCFVSLRGRGWGWVGVRHLLRVVSLVIEALFLAFREDAAAAADDWLGLAR